MFFTGLEDVMEEGQLTLDDHLNLYTQKTLNKFIWKYHLCTTFEF